jgi:hypothetical protein
MVDESSWFDRFKTTIATLLLAAWLLLVVYAHLVNAARLPLSSAVMTFIGGVIVWFCWIFRNRLAESAANGRGPDPDLRVNTHPATVLVSLFLLVVLAFFLWLAVHRGEVEALAAGLLLFLAAFTIWFVALFLNAIKDHGTPQVETNWGGLGGGLGGWRFSVSLVYLLIGVFFAVLLTYAASTVLALHAIGRQPPPASPSSPVAGQASKTDAAARNPATAGEAAKGK